MKTKQINTNLKRKQQAGFTLVELLIVVVILGILAAMTFGTFSSSATSTATAQQYYNLANQGTRAWSQMIAVSGAPRTITANPVFESGNDLLDMLVGGEEVVASNYKNSYRRAGLAPSEDMVQILNYPSQGTSGEYRLGTVDVSVNDDTQTGYLNWLFEGVSQEVVSALIEQHEPSIESYELGDPVNDSRRIRAEEAEGGLMDLTIVTRVQ